nr:hypothetical protein Iba_chr12cCG16950 [Ipomoea batatas]
MSEAKKDEREKRAVVDRSSVADFSFAADASPFGESIAVAADLPPNAQNSLRSQIRRRTQLRRRRLAIAAELVVAVFAEVEFAAITIAELVATAAERSCRRSRELFAITFTAESRVAVAPPSPSQQTTPDIITIAAAESSIPPRDLYTNTTDSKEIHHRGRRQIRDLLTL